ncbi:MAG: glutathione S-transferase family protein [Deltaproteobacteria bacterium]|nr:glutathione S-transferase family protein [Deltaproteobacteria bacterium]
MITLFGTVTSPFVRRVRVVALEKGLPLTLVDVVSPEGQAQLRALSPIAKVPVAVLADGRVVFDSRVIIDELCHPDVGGHAPLREPAGDLRGRVDEENAITLVDEGLLCLIRLFYLKRDGADLSVAYLQKEHARAATILQYLNDNLVGNYLTKRNAEDGGFGRPELALFSALGWIRFRNAFDLSTTTKLLAFVDHWASRPSLAQTPPDPK